MTKEKNKLFLTDIYRHFIPRILLSFICAGILTEYLKLPGTSVILFPIAATFYLLQEYVWKNREEFGHKKWWYCLFSLGISVVLVVCKHMVMQFYDFYSDITANYIEEYTGYDLIAFLVLLYAFMLLSFGMVQLFSSTRIYTIIFENVKAGAKKNTEVNTGGISKEDISGKNCYAVGISSTKWFIILTIVLFICWLPYLILYYPAIIYGDSTMSIGQAIGKWKYGDMHPFMFTMFVKFCISLSHLIGRGNTFGCAIYSVLQMLYMGGIFAYSICWLRNKNISKKICFFVLLFFALPRFWGQHAVSMWKDPIFAMAVYFYSFKLFDLIYSRGKVSKDKKYIVQCMLTILVMCFSRHNGKYVALFSLILMMVCTLLGKNRCVLKKSLILATAATIVFCCVIQGPVFRHFGILGTAAGAYGVPLQQVARTVVYEGNISEEEKEFLDKIMPLEKYRENYSPGLVDHMKWSDDFDSAFFREHHREFLKVWLSLLIKNPKLYVEAWAMDTCGFWGLSYWELNSYTGNSAMGVPKGPKMLKKNFKIHSGSLLGENSKLNVKLKEYFSLATPMPSVALCLWIALFMILYAIVKGKWRYLLFFIPCLGNIATLLIATPICYWPRYGLSSICMLPVSLLFPYLIGRNVTAHEKSRFDFTIGSKIKATVK